MTDRHYKMYMEEFSYTIDLRDFLMEILILFRVLVENTVFPSDWVEMIMLQNRYVGVTSVLYWKTSFLFWVTSVLYWKTLFLFFVTSVIYWRNTSLLFGKQIYLSHLMLDNEHYIFLQQLEMS